MAQVGPDEDVGLGAEVLVAAAGQEVDHLGGGPSDER